MGTQRWGSTDFNAPDDALCHAFLDRAVDAGVSLIDCAEQYPIPSGPSAPEGSTEEIVGRWLAGKPSRRAKLTIATKITGGSRISARSIAECADASLRRLRTDYIDVYLLHWPARYTPQANWGQSLEYHHDLERARPYRDAATFADIAGAMGELVRQGKIRAWGACNDNAVGLCLMTAAARQLGVAPPAAMQNDYSLINRRVDENGLSEASSAANLNCGFIAYNVLGGGVLTGKYLDQPAAADLRDAADMRKRLAAPRGRHDDAAWGPTLYRYRSAAAQAATRAYAQLAREAGMNPTELALRWCRERRSVTSALVGWTSMQQLEETLRCYTKGPLPASLLWEIDRIHMRNRLPIFASDRAGRDWDGEGEIGEPIP